ncbi:MAG: signal peptide peptidase SppA [Betaproteobacteria bacterium]
MRKRVLVLGVIGLALLSVVVLIQMRPPSPSNQRFATRGRLGAPGNRIAVVYLDGPIAEGRSSLSTAGGITPRLVARYLEKLEADSSVKAVVLRIDSPGGSVAASQAIAGMIEEFSKPVVISMGDIAASGGYYIATPADRIFAMPGTMTGSIGVITSILDLHGLYDKLGIKDQVIKSGRHKDMYQRTLTPEERELVQKLSDVAYEQFVTYVATHRGLAVERVRELATGELFLGSQAVELGLVDSLGDLDDAVAAAAELAGVESPVVYEVPAPVFLVDLWNLLGEVQAFAKALVLSPEERLLWRLREEPTAEMRY